MLGHEKNDGVIGFESVGCGIGSCVDLLDKALTSLNGKISVEERRAQFLDLTCLVTWSRGGWKS